MKKANKFFLLCLSVCILFCGSVTFFAANAADTSSETVTADTGSGQTKVTASTVLQNQPTFSVTIPQSIPMGNLQRAATRDENSKSYADFSVSVSKIESLGSNQIRVSVSTKDGEFKLYNGSYALPYEVLCGDKTLNSGDDLAIFTEDKTVAGKIAVDRYDIAAEGNYEGTLIFTVTVEEASD